MLRVLKGLHVKDIAKSRGVDPNKLCVSCASIHPRYQTHASTARILRLLVTYNIFREVTPDVFANNRVSSFLDTGKSIANILAKYACVALLLSSH